MTRTQLIYWAFVLLVVGILGTSGLQLQAQTPVTQKFTLCQSVTGSSFALKQGTCPAPKSGEKYLPLCETVQGTAYTFANGVCPTPTPVPTKTPKPTPTPKRK